MKAESNVLTTITTSLLGGGLMFAVGALYLFLEKRILTVADSDDEVTKPMVDERSRLILGVQVSS